jgi:hypothetical protein
MKRDRFVRVFLKTKTINVPRKEKSCPGIPGQLFDLGIITLKYNAH